MNTINLTQPDLSILTGHLKMGGKNPQGVEISANSRYFTLGGSPWLPVMGEIHYSRCAAEDWRDKLLKMKAGGIQVAASYIFWIHHEEIEGQIHWEGQRNLRRFIQECGECGLYAYPRIGPWVHGEARNGGFPDWLLARCTPGDGQLPQVRQDHPLYLAYVQRWYEAIAAQLEGLLWKDGGPVIGIQLDNELADNPTHLLTLKRLARQAGLDTPVYTMTGWGPAQIPPGDELIPVFGGYADACWDRQVDDWSRPSRKHYFFSPIRDDNAIGADLLKPTPNAPAEILERYPYGACEIGGGMPLSYHRRPLIRAEDVAALALVKVGNGNNLQGYYMFHGGSNPRGQRVTLQESQASGYPNDYPIFNYDFQAPLGEFGQVHEVYHALRPLHLFLNDFGARLAPLPMTLPDESVRDLGDRAALRWAVRSDGERGFVFINNYQRLEPLPDHASLQLELRLRQGEGQQTLRLPEQPATLPSGAYTIWPFNLEMDGVLLQTATAQLICRIAGEIPAYVFFTPHGMEAQFLFEEGVQVTPEQAEIHDIRSQQGKAIMVMTQDGGSALIVHGADGKSARLILLNEKDARQCWKAIFGGRERLFLSPAGLIFDPADQNSLRLRARKPEDLWFACFPPLDPEAHREKLFAGYHCQADEKTPAVKFTRLSEASPAQPARLGPQGVATPPEDSAFEQAESWQISLAPGALDGLHDLFLMVDYQGDQGRAYLGATLAADDFYGGRPWELSLRRWMSDILAEGLTLRFLPLAPGAPIYFQPELRPASSPANLVKKIWLEAEYEQTFQVYASQHSQG